MRGNGIEDNAGLQRVVVDRVTPEIDRGRFPIKRACGRIKFSNLRYGLFSQTVTRVPSIGNWPFALR